MESLRRILAWIREELRKLGTEDIRHLRLKEVERCIEKAICVYPNEYGDRDLRDQLVFRAMILMEDAGVFQHDTGDDNQLSRRSPSHDATGGRIES